MTYWYTKFYDYCFGINREYFEYMTLQNKSKKKNKILSFFKWLVITLVALIIVCVVAFKIYTSKYYRADSMIINLINNISDDRVHTFSDKDGMVFIPQQEYRAVIVFYPGGKVEYTAYCPLLYQLAARGFICILPKMPENLALLSVDAVEKIGRGHQEERESVANLEWYLAGHSLGGVAAATYLGDGNDDDYAGLILCASYTTSDFTDSNIRLLSIYGSEDKVLNRGNYDSSKSLWPKDSTEYVIEGGIHSYFGSYGIQNGDGVPEISNNKQIEITAEKIDEWINER